MLSRLVTLTLLVLALVPLRVAAQPLDATPRIAVVSAFAPELKAILQRTEVERTESVNGVAFSLGRLSGKPVVVFASGVSMVNAAMTTQLALDRFNLTALVVTGIAGGVNPDLRIGDVTVPARWGQYLEAVLARETGAGFTLPSWTGKPFANHGMIFPQEVTVRRAGEPGGAKRFWFEADPALLAVAEKVAASLRLGHCAAADRCLDRQPRIVVGGNGVSGQAFVDNAAFREYVFRTFQANVLDMETAAVATVAFANDKSFIAFRSLSDLAGGGEGENEIATFMDLASENSAAVLAGFLAALP